MLHRFKSVSRFSFFTTFACAAVLAAGVALAQEEVESDGAAEPKPAADEVLTDMLEDMRPARRPAPAEQPVADEGGDAVEATLTPTPNRRGVMQDVSAADIRGVAPSLPEAQLRREGEFVVNRVGRLVYGSESSLPLFAFAADSQANPEAPMVLMPCRMLEAMEKLVANNAGQSPAITVTGQVFVYNGRNYLLPTLMRENIDRGNLEP